MQITSLTDFPSKLAHVYMIKVSFLLENKNRTGERGEGKGGVVVGGGVIKPLPQLFCLGASSPARGRGGGCALAAAISPCFVYPKSGWL